MLPAAKHINWYEICSGNAAEWGKPMLDRPKKRNLFSETISADAREQQGPIEPNLRRLRILLAVGECGSIQHAAQKLHLTQSLLTRAVRELEREIGHSLFERSAHGMLVT